MVVAYSRTKKSKLRGKEVGSRIAGSIPAQHLIEELLIEIVFPY
jgi:hypothetical protein